ncbi:hypothetical protein BH20ACT23_BH20ACT23_13330 [soil metagenome]
MGIGNIVKVTTYLGDRGAAEVNTAVRKEVLRNHCPALTVIIAEILDVAGCSRSRS